MIDDGWMEWLLWGIVFGIFLLGIIVTWGAFWDEEHTAWEVRESKRDE